MSKNGVILTIFTAAITCVYNVSNLQVPGSGPVVKSSGGAPPLIEPSPGINRVKPGNGAIASLAVWNLKPFEGKGPGQIPSLKDMFKPYYLINRTGRFESIYRSDRQNDKWEFQGVLLTGGSLRALFYNPAQTGKKLRILAPGDAVDARLVVREIGKNKVVLRLMGEKKPQDFELRIFNSNKENYVHKRKAV